MSLKTAWSLINYSINKNNDHERIAFLSQIHFTNVR